LNTEIRFGDFIVREADPRNWVLDRDTGRPAKDKAGVPTGANIVEFIGWYGSPAAALESALAHGLRGQGRGDVQALLSRIEMSVAEIKAAVNGARDLVPA
jgi:hypothetical protein